MLSAILRCCIVAALAYELCGCSVPGTRTPYAPETASRRALGSGQMLYAYSPNEKARVATYAADASGSVSPASMLQGTQAQLVGGKMNDFGGGIDVASDGTLYVLDGVRGELLTFAPGATGNQAPLRVARLPRAKKIYPLYPHYGGLALDTAGSFWTADRTTGNLLRFALDASGNVQPTYTLKPKVEENELVPGVAATVASDGLGNIWCVCQPDDLALQLYCITEYHVAGVARPHLVRSFYGIYGDLATQIPPDVLHVDPHANTVYVGTWTPDWILEYPANTPTGPAPKARIIAGSKTTLDAQPTAITTDAAGNVYVALASRIAVFAKGAAGNHAPNPLRRSAPAIRRLPPLAGGEAPQRPVARSMPPRWHCARLI
jgi:sugar lactone lactonase YvrE